MKHSSTNFALSSKNRATAKYARPTTATSKKGIVSRSGKRSALLLLSLLLLLPLLSSCSKKALYIRGDKGSSGQVNANPMTGSFSLIITGPYEVCSIPLEFQGKALEVCQPHNVEVNP